MKTMTLTLIAGASLITAAIGLSSLGGGSAAPASPSIGLQSPVGSTLAMCPQCCPPEICGTNGPSLDGNAEPSCDAADE